MHHSKRTDISNGYIMKLYRRAENVSEEAIIDDSMFMTWMNFDCMDVIKIYDFQEYHNLVDVSDNPPREIYASWQKLFLYRLKRKNRQYQDWESAELKKAFNGYKVYSILGKYDFDIVGEITSPEKFVALFLKRRLIKIFIKKYLLFIL